MNSSIRTIGKLLVIAALPLLASSNAFAQATRTWVSGVGDDVNPCSRTAPCKTFAGAISKTAAGGEISVLDPGGFGTVTITKSLTISGDGVVGSILSALAPQGIIVNAQPTDVVIIRNIAINGAGTGTDGIRFIAGGELHVERVTIINVAGHGINFAPTGTSALFVDNSSIRNVTTGAVIVKPSPTGTAVATLNTLSMDGNGRGVRVEDGSTVIVRNSQATGNGANGFVGISAAVTPRPINMTLENVVSSGNGAAGIHAGAQATIRLSNVTVTNNNDGILNAGGTTVSFGNNRVHGNLFNNGPASTNVGQQ